MWAGLGSVGRRVGATGPLCSVVGQGPPVTNNRTLWSRPTSGRQAGEEIHQGRDQLDQGAEFQHQLDKIIDTERATGTRVKPACDEPEHLGLVVVVQAGSDRNRRSHKSNLSPASLAGLHSAKAV